MERQSHCKSIKETTDNTKPHNNVSGGSMQEYNRRSDGKTIGQRHLVFTEIWWAALLLIRFAGNYKTIWGFDK